MKKHSKNDDVVIMPDDCHCFDVPLPFKDKFYVNWIFEDGKLKLELKRQKCEGDVKSKDDAVIFTGELSKEKPAMDYKLDLKMPDPIPHLTINGTIELKHIGLKPSGITLTTDINASNIKVHIGNYTFKYEWLH